MAWAGLACRLLGAALLLYWDPLSLTLLVLCWIVEWPGGIDQRDGGGGGSGSGAAARESSAADGTISTQEESQAKSAEDVIDGAVRSSLLHQALKKVFDCSYSQFILSWYDPPEATADQPLYHVLLHEFNTAVDYALGKIRNLNFTRIDIRLIQILTIHLRNVKKKTKREKVFQSRQDEVYFLRRTATDLIHNLLPETLWKLNCYQSVMREAIALKALEETINKVCDADFINQSLIRCLDQASLAPEEKDSIPEVPAVTEKNSEPIPECNQVKEKKKMTRKQKVIHWLKKKTNSKKLKKRRGIEADSAGTDMDEVDGLCYDAKNMTQHLRSIHHTDDDSVEDNDFDSSHEVFEWLKTSFLESNEEKTSLKCCKITISEIAWDKEEEPLCTIDIENRDDAEECWSVQRKYHEFQDLRNELVKTFNSLSETQLPSVNGLASGEISKKFREDFEHQMAGFVKTLISDESILCSEMVLNFFSADDRDYWGLLTSLFAEEDEETDVESVTSGGSRDKDVDDGEETERPKTSPGNVEIQDTASNKSLPSTSSSDTPECDLSFRSMAYSPDEEDVQKANISHIRRRVTGRFTKPPEGISGLLHELLEEIMYIEQSDFKITVLMQLVKYILAIRKKSLKKSIDKYFSKEQVASYIDQLREVLWPNGIPACPSPERSDEEKAIAKEKAIELLLSKAPAFFRVFLHGKEVINNLMTVFQDVETNKRLVYKALVFLLFELIPEIKDSWKEDPRLCLEDLNFDQLDERPL
ncbi:uncharacterized protein LOC144600740 [Rhinoraja longicauda]